MILKGDSLMLPPVKTASKSYTSSAKKYSLLLKDLKKDHCVELGIKIMIHALKEH